MVTKGGLKHIVDNSARNRCMGKKHFVHLEDLPEAVIMTDRDGRIVYLNNKSLVMAGMKSIDQGYDTSTFDWVCQEDHQRFTEYRKRVFSGNKMGPDEFTVRIVDGTIITIEAHTSPVFDENGNVTNSITIIRDITEKKAREKKLAEQEILLKTLIDTNPESRLLMGTDYKVIAANATAARRFGKRVDELIGYPLKSLFTKELSKARTKKFDEVVKTGQSLMFRDMREGRWYDIHLDPVKDSDGNVTQIAVHASDIT